MSAPGNTAPGPFVARLDIFAGATVYVAGYAAGTLATADRALAHRYRLRARAEAEGARVAHLMAAAGADVACTVEAAE